MCNVWSVLTIGVVLVCSVQLARAQAPDDSLTSSEEEQLGAAKRAAPNKEWFRLGKRAARNKEWFRLGKRLAANDADDLVAYEVIGPVDVDDAEEGTMQKRRSTDKQWFRMGRKRSAVGSKRRADKNWFRLAGRR